VRFNDAVLGIVLIGFASIAALATRSFPAMPGQDYGPALFPLIVCGGLAACGLLLVASGIRHRRTQPLVVLDPWARSAKGIGSLALVVGGLVFYILVSETLGFIPTAFLLVAAIMVRLRGRWLSSLVLSAAVTLVIYQVFANLLLVPLPLGILEPLIYG
jgi:putative tricarboxylic transport membrane protein